MIDALRRYLRSQQFNPGLLGAFLNPFFHFLLYVPAVPFAVLSGCDLALRCYHRAGVVTRISHGRTCEPDIEDTSVFANALRFKRSDSPAVP